ncbi:glycoside hydrolase family 16 protein [Hydnum rufescens UP504]|uniref:Glycoside hydrolase family 16 protein n=1 Tax=Hydnum rufescens UP504 TaxID=1448309 RepID=A0A9P6AUE1_9AGAM|nr:glycoside hydrolase family 16 protein [Hydnum rufescens UP504]
MVNYLDANAATHTGLAYVQNDGVVVMKVDNSTDLPNGSPRNSIRISSKKSYDGGLFIFDILNAPYGCGVWPAFWTVGPNWPNGGEIDIFEGVHLGPTNQMTLHTQVGCATDISSAAPSAFRTASSASTVGTTDCGPSPTNGGCYFIDKSSTSYGEALNSSGGAVIAMEWTAHGVKIWNFPRGHVPRDITLQTPIPALWPQTYLKAAWASTSCPTTKYFKQHSITIDTTLCGDWAGATYSRAGCPGTCAEHVMTGANFANAAWKINSVSIYK